MVTKFREGIGEVCEEEGKRDMRMGGERKERGGLIN